MDVVWDTPADRKAEPQGEGAWLSGGTLVRSRFDAVSGFDARTGKRSWEYVPPGRSAVCHATADTDGSVLVLTRDGDGATASAKGKPCATAVAVDMKDGRELWKAPLSEPDPPRFQHSSVSAGSGVAVLLQKDDLHAVDVRTGKSRWKAALPKDCVPGRTAVAERQVAALLACGGTDNIWGDKVTEDAELHVATFDPATGALLWSAPLGGRRAILWDASAAFVSADPVVVAASESNDSDAGAYLSFGRNGRPNPPVDFSGPYGEIGFSDRLRAAVDGSRLYLLPRHRKVERLTAFDLATGDAVWAALATTTSTKATPGTNSSSRTAKSPFSPRAAAAPIVSMTSIPPRASGARSGSSPTTWALRTSSSRTRAGSSSPATPPIRQDPGPSRPTNVADAPPSRRLAP
ncbi:PQQ-binding-like beta-propeller repeat protein [Streptomyces exfoliatus]|uniref:PQQ-binding-like beta-propeller repeat protein n=1 Tax=Streptomyces exfoliatus TaxID=1905 RepID=A0ABV3D836_STREX